VKREEKNVTPQANSKNERNALNETRFTRYASRCFVHPASRFTRYASRSSAGFTLLEVIGVLAVMAALLSILLPKIIDQLDRSVQEMEAQTLPSIGKGVEAYVRQNRDWPASLTALSPEFVSFGDEQLRNNGRSYPRYLVIHPDSTPYDNGNGIAPSNISDYRFLVITDLTQDVSPTINNAAQFDNWWNTDDSIRPDLVIQRGTIKPHLHVVSLSAKGTGGSYRIDGQVTDSGGGTLAPYGQFHVAHSVIELSEDDTFGAGGGITMAFSLIEDVGFQFDSGCAAGAKWHMLGEAC